jgi:hypothetical protein
MADTFIHTAYPLPLAFFPFPGCRLPAAGRHSLTTHFLLKSATEEQCDELGVANLLSYIICTAQAEGLFRIPHTAHRLPFYFALRSAP